VLVASIVSPGVSKAQQWKCETGKAVLDRLAHDANLGSSLLVLSEETAGAVVKKTAAYLAAAVAVYQVAKDVCEGSQTTYCNLLFCTQESPAGPGNALSVLAHGPSFQNSWEIEQKLLSSTISKPNLSDPKTLSQTLKPLFPNGGWSGPNLVKDFRPSGSSLSSLQINELTRSLLGDCGGSKAACLVDKVPNH
jgi:hypothetical protein